MSATHPRYRSEIVARARCLWLTSNVLVRCLPLSKDGLHMVPPQSQERNPYKEGHRNHQQIQRVCQLGAGMRRGAGGRGGSRHARQQPPPYTSENASTQVTKRPYTNRQTPPNTFVMPPNTSLNAPRYIGKLPYSTRVGKRLHTGQEREGKQTPKRLFWCVFYLTQ